MNPLLLLALIGGGAVVAYKVVTASKCPTTPPANPFCPAGGGGIDWDALAANLGKNTTGTAETDKWLTAVQKIGVMIPVYGWYAAAAATALKAISHYFAENANSASWTAAAKESAETLMTMGYIPVTSNGDWTMRDISGYNRDRIDAITGAKTQAPPYLMTLIQGAGGFFKKWGGGPLVLPRAMPLLVDSHIGSAPTLTPGEELDPLLAPIAACIAYDYGVCDHVEEVVAAAKYGHRNFQTMYPSWLNLGGTFAHFYPKDLPPSERADFDAHKDDLDASGNVRFLHPVASGHVSGNEAVYNDDGGREQETPLTNGLAWAIPCFAYAAGMHAAMTVAANLAKKPAPPPFTWWSMNSADGQGVAPPPPPPKVEVSAQDAAAGGVKVAADVKRLLGR